MNFGQVAKIPLSLNRAFDLGRKLQQQTIAAKAGLDLHAERQAIGVAGKRQAKAWRAAKIAERGIGEEAPEIEKPVEGRGIVGCLLYTSDAADEG